MNSNHFQKAILARGVLGIFTIASPAFASGPQPNPILFLDEEVATVQQCFATGETYQDVIITTSMLDRNAQRSGPSFFDPSHSQASCADYTWFSVPLTNRLENLVFVGFGGPNINHQVNCQHSTLTYVVMKRIGSGPWTAIGGGLIYGNLRDGRCDHAYRAANLGAPTDWFDAEQTGWPAPLHVVKGGNGAPNDLTVIGEIRVAAYSWAHNAHNQNLCDGLNCYFPTWVVAF